MTGLAVPPEVQTDLNLIKIQPTQTINLSMRKQILFPVFSIFILHSAIATALYSQADEGSSKNAESSNRRSHRYPSKFGVGASRNEWSVWSGVSFGSPAGTFIGATRDREFFILSLQYARRIIGNRVVTLEYTLDFIPVAVVTKNPKVDLSSRRVFTGDGRGHIATGVSPVYGFGIAPVGFKFHLLQGRHARVFISGSGGFLAFEENVPHPDARKLNFTFDFGGGVQILANSHWGVSLGYKLHHLSNANTADVNPGLDASIFYIGISSFR